MKFCEVCGSFMVRTARGLRCPKCGEVVTLDVIEVRRAGKPVVEPVYVIENVGDEALKVAQRCPSAVTTRPTAVYTPPKGSTPALSRTDP